MNNTQPEKTTHHVMYRVRYFEAYDNVINGIKEHFHQPDFEIYKHVQKNFINAANLKVTKTLSIYLRWLAWLI